MTKRKFTPISGDLSRLTEDQQREYVLSACEFLQVDPALGLVVLAHMDVGDGSRQLLLYVRKGATDIIRDRYKITTTKLDQFLIEGCVGWIVTGVNKDGRQEMAVGAVSIKGLGAAQVANALKTAQTQACRRMTLQFMGGGFLDESEIDPVKTTTVDIANAPTPLAEIAQPQVAVNSSAGQDVSDVALADTPQQEPLDSAVGAVSVKGGSSEEVSPQVSDVVSTQVIPAEEPKRRRRLSRKTISLDTPVVEQPKIPETKFATPEPAPNVETNQAATPAVEVVVPEKGSTVLNLDTVDTKDQEAQFREKLSKYVNEILPEGGFIQSEGMSRNAKIGIFVKKLIPGISTKSMTLEQWTTFFGFMDSKYQEAGAKGLVDYINAQIGG